MAYTPTTTDLLKCAQRELALRKRVYRNRVETRRMSAGEAEFQIICMQAIVEHFERLVEKERLL